MKKILILTLAIIASTNLIAQKNANKALSTGLLPYKIQLELTKEMEKQNFVFSPASISTALQMAATGAKGDTKVEFNRLLATDSKPCVSTISGKCKVNVTNAIWVQNDYPINASFKKEMANNFKAEAKLCDFKSDKKRAKARNAINQWAKQQTNGKIKELIPSNALDKNTRLLLTNTIDFSGEWATPFKSSNTWHGDFFGDTTQRASFMQQTQMLNFYSDGNIQAVELPYNGNQLSMYIIMPKGRTITEMLSRFKNGILNDIAKVLRPTSIILSMPKFNTNTATNVSETLKNIGLKNAFSNIANFSGISQANDLKIGAVFHNATIIVDEKGTEAAAATAIEMIAKSSLSRDIPVLFDHPFVYYIVNKATNEVLFAGQFVNAE
ncbi:MAG: serpin family protein [Salinivirgaceae bacterium]|nr:serpin family protein [Salinivirgaceae bacterium]